MPRVVPLSRKDIDELTEFVKIYGAKGLAYVKIEMVSGIRRLPSFLQRKRLLS
jgi:aspartyl-tRNA synthetase